LPAVKKAPRSVDELMRTFAHPYRPHILHVLSKQSIASPKEMAFAMKVDVNKLSYHVRELAKLGYLELVRTEQRRGATEHFYRATERAFFDDDEWVRLPLPVRKGITGQMLLATGAAVSTAVAAGTFEGRPDRHHTLLEYDVDETGWKETVEILADAEEKLIEAKAASAERLLKDQDQRIPVAVSMLGFERAKG